MTSAKPANSYLRTPQAIEMVIDELADEDVLACGALFSITETVYSTKIPTLAVRAHRGEAPQLWINPEFLERHVESESELRFLLMHEFFHVVHEHLSLYPALGPIENIAMDAVVNHALDRRLGPDATAFTRKYYHPLEPNDPLWLLRPRAPREADIPSAPEHEPLIGNPTRGIPPSKLREMRRHLAAGLASVDDVRDFLRQHAVKIRLKPGDVLGGHDPATRRFRIFDSELRDALEAAAEILKNELKSIGHNPGLPGHTEAEARKSHWLESARPLIERFLVRTAGPSRPVPAPAPTLQPVPVPGDRRAFLRSLHSPIIPDYAWLTERPAPAPSRKVAVYVDVSGSMSGELELAAGFLLELGDLVHPPVWAWSDSVEKAEFRGNRLVTRSTGGTDIDCVLEHFSKRRDVSRAVVLTDGYIHRPDSRLRRRLEKQGKSWGAIVTPRGDAAPFQQLSIPHLVLPSIKPANP